MHRNTILRGIAVLWGGVILLFSFGAGRPRGGGGYGAGRMVGTVFVLVFLVAIVFYVIDRVKNLSPPPRRRKRRRRKRRKPPEDSRRS